VFQLLRQGLRPEVVQVIRALPFVLFLALGISVASAREPMRRRRRIQMLLAYLVTAHLLLVATQIDAWPFSPYRMMAVDARVHDDLRRMIAFRGVDAAGREWKLDPYAWSPLFPQAVMGWFEVVWPHASPEDREAVMRFLLDRAEEARRRRSGGSRVGNERILGRLTAPDMNLPPPLEGLPEGPFVALRVYRVYWRPSEFAVDPRRTKRALLIEYRAP
jgi:hypothetical protein